MTITSPSRYTSYVCCVPAGDAVPSYTQLCPFARSVMGRSPINTASLVHYFVQARSFTKFTCTALYTEAEGQINILVQIERYSKPGSPGLAQPHLTASPTLPQIA